MKKKKIGNKRDYDDYHNEHYDCSGNYHSSNWYDRCSDDK